MEAGIKELPELKRKLEETQEFLNQLNKSKGAISKERFSSPEQKYFDQIAEYEEKINELTDQGRSSKLELQTEMDLHADKRNSVEEYLNGITLLHDQSAISDQEFKTNSKSFKKEIREFAKKGDQPPFLSPLVLILKNFNLYFLVTHLIEVTDYGPTIII